MRSQTTVQLCDANEDVYKALISAALSLRYRYFLSTTLPMRVVTSSERHLTRLRIWLGKRVFENLGSAGVCLVWTSNGRKIQSRHPFRRGRKHGICLTPYVYPRSSCARCFRHRRSNLHCDGLHAPELTYVWHKLTEVQKKAIFAQLRDFIGQLRSLEPRILVVFKQWTRLVSFILEYAWMIVHLGHFPLLQNFILTLATTACSISKRCRQYFPSIEAMAQRHYRIAFAHLDLPKKYARPEW
ncbi:hypothetical protein F5J12DRAFT_532638 [Pisolithus orientalis]|uniref:uncharacterized protein n=1 Tax=Pisolithus orientalis TaxID=936130 RepID=UPI002224DE44|nr:uncharacterized protein F5J12DRAFT_532638 [Pisolithus orientalis]KAI5987941.1 hypothetical protein F5J12DRAFT_532638 [Pisolithus orientalis]